MTDRKIIHQRRTAFGKPEKPLMNITIGSIP
jgi:hypothetical protein